MIERLNDINPIEYHDQSMVTPWLPCSSSISRPATNILIEKCLSIGRLHGFAIVETTFFIERFEFFFLGLGGSNLGQPGFGGAVGNGTDWNILMMVLGSFDIHLVEFVTWTLESRSKGAVFRLLSRQ